MSDQQSQKKSKTTKSAEKTPTPSKGTKQVRRATSEKLTQSTGTRVDNKDNATTLLCRSAPAISTPSRYPHVSISLFIEPIPSTDSEKTPDDRSVSDKSKLIDSSHTQTKYDSVEKMLAAKSDYDDDEPSASTSKLAYPPTNSLYRSRAYPNVSAAPATYTSRYSVAPMKTHSIYSGLSTPNNFISSPTSFVSETGTANERFDQFTASTSIVLQQCETEILCHYNRFLTLIGWRPLSMTWLSQIELNWLVNIFNWLYLGSIFLLLFASYFLQFASCYRHDNLQPYILLQHQEDMYSLSSGGGGGGGHEPNRTVVNYQMISLADPNNASYQPSEGKFQWWMRKELEGFRENLTEDKEKELEEEEEPAESTKDNLEDDAEQPISLKQFYEVEKRFYDLLQVIYDRYYNASLHNGQLVTAHHQHQHLYQCRGGVFIYYFFPSLLHLIAFVTVLRYVRLPEADRFQNLCVLSYLIVTKVYGREKSRLMLKRIIRNWLLFCCLALIASIISNGLHLFVVDSICFTFIQPETDMAIVQLKTLSMILFSLNDFVCIAIVTMYSLHCELNILFLKANEIALRQKRIDFHEFTKNTEESKINIDFLNDCISTGLSILLIHFSTRLIVSLIDLFSRVMYLESNSTILSVYSLLIWFSLVVISMVQAARVTDACSSMRHIGHELRARPFCYQSAAYHDLDSLLNYTSSLHLKARIIMIPVRASCVASMLLVFTFTLLVAGQLSMRYNL